MSEPLALLLIEDCDEDALLVERALRRAGLAFTLERVQEEPALRVALARRAWDVALVDNALPRFEGLRALEVIRELGLELPVIVVSGTLGEEAAVAAMRAGARDYVMKTALGRLGASVVREVEEASARRARSSAEERARWTEAFLRTISDNSPLGIFVTDPGERAVQYHNRRFREIHGLGADDLPDEATPASVRDACAARISRVEAFGEPGGGGALEEILRLGDGRVVRRLSTPIRDPDGVALGGLEIHEDVSARWQAEDALRRQEEQLRHLQKMDGMGRLAAGIAHDFNNMLQTISAISCLIRSDPGLAPETREAVGDIEAANERAAALVRQLMVFSRKQVLRPVDVDLGDVVRGVARMLESALGSRVSLALDLSPAPCPARVDPGPMGQVLLNLVINARDAIPGRGAVTIATSAAPPDPRRPGAWVTLSVSDTGSGIPPDVLPRIFEPFFTTKAAGAGTGLGLSTVYGIVTQSGGHIEVTSAPGRGSTFVVSLPRAAAAAPQGRPRILLVDADPPTRVEVLLALAVVDALVLEAKDALEALELAAHLEGPLDLLITDLEPPGLDGRELVQRLRARRPGLRVLAVSDAAGPLDLELSTSLRRPVRADDLVREVRALLGRQPAAGA